MLGLSNFIAGRLVLAAALVVLGGAAADVAFAVPGAPGMTRTEIRSMPIEQRPDRPGHFYGNAVRRQHRRGR